jgi:hypothetical protein
MQFQPLYPGDRIQLLSNPELQELGFNEVQSQDLIDIFGDKTIQVKEALFLLGVWNIKVDMYFYGIPLCHQTNTFPANWFVKVGECQHGMCFINPPFQITDRLSVRNPRSLQEKNGFTDEETLLLNGDFGAGSYVVIRTQIIYGLWYVKLESQHHIYCHKGRPIKKEPGNVRDSVHNLFPASWFYLPEI